MKRAFVVIAISTLMIAVDSQIVVETGGDHDGHGCKLSTGEYWCEASQKCIPWDEKCTSLLQSGGDRDEHGCKPSTGQVWCEASQKCIYPWIDGKCPTLLQTGGDHDSKGCKPSTGEVWCEASQKCIFPWVEKCPSLLQSGGDRDKHGCKPSTGQVWCEASQKCIYPWIDGKCPTLLQTGGDHDSKGCKPSTGEVWCEASQKCIFPWVEKCPTQLLRGSNKSLIGYWTYADSSGCIQTTLNYAALWITMKGTGIDTGHPSSTIKHGKDTCADQGYTVKVNEFDDLPLVFRAVYLGVTAWAKPSE